MHNSFYSHVDMVIEHSLLCTIAIASMLFKSKINLAVHWMHWNYSCVCVAVESEGLIIKRTNQFYRMKSYYKYCIIEIRQHFLRQIHSTCKCFFFLFFFNHNPLFLSHPHILFLRLYILHFVCYVWPIFMIHVQFFVICFTFAWCNLVEHNPSYDFIVWKSRKTPFLLFLVV